MLSIKTFKNTYYYSSSEGYKNELIPSRRRYLLNLFAELHSESKFNTDMNTNCGLDFKIEITDTEDDGLPYPNVEDYTIPTYDELHTNPDELDCYFFKADHIQDYDGMI